MVVWLASCETVTVRCWCFQTELSSTTTSGILQEAQDLLRSQHLDHQKRVRGGGKSRCARFKRLVLKTRKIVMHGNAVSPFLSVHRFLAEENVVTRRSWVNCRRPHASFMCWRFSITGWLVTPWLALSGAISLNAIQNSSTDSCLYSSATAAVVLK